MHLRRFHLILPAFGLLAQLGLPIYVERHEIHDHRPVVESADHCTGVPAEHRHVRDESLAFDECPVCHSLSQTSTRAFVLAGLIEPAPASGSLALRGREAPARARAESRSNPSRAPPIG